VNHRKKIFEQGFEDFVFKIISTTKNQFFSFWSQRNWEINMA
jgi:hypothetical protein